MNTECIIPITTVAAVAWAQFHNKQLSMVTSHNAISYPHVIGVLLIFCLAETFKAEIKHVSANKYRKFLAKQKSLKLSMEEEREPMFEK